MFLLIRIIHECVFFWVSGELIPVNCFQVLLKIHNSVFILVKTVIDAVTRPWKIQWVMAENFLGSCDLFLTNVIIFFCQIYLIVCDLRQI